MRVALVLGTAREGRQSEKVAFFAKREAEKAGWQVDFIDVRDYRIQASDNSGKIPQAIKWRKTLAKADAMLIVSPEYNHSFPGELKMFLDLLYPEYYHVPVAFCTVSSGQFGGVRALSKLKEYALALGMIPTSYSILFPTVQESFDEKGETKGKAYYGKMKELFEELAWHAQRKR